MGSTNYTNTFFQVADDCPVQVEERPPESGKSPTVAALQYALIANRPYELTSDDLLFEVFAMRNTIPEGIGQRHARSFSPSLRHSCAYHR